MSAQPIDMVLYCPRCHVQHIDAPECTDMSKWTPERYGDWTNPPHRSHLCHGCGFIWRPADVPTNGVATIQTKGKDDMPLVHVGDVPQAVTLEESERQIVAESPPLVCTVAGVVGVLNSAQAGLGWYQDTNPEQVTDADEVMRMEIDSAVTFLAQVPERQELRALLPASNVYLDEPDGGDVSLIEQLRRMAADAAKWRMRVKDAADAAKWRTRVEDAADAVKWRELDGRMSGRFVTLAELEAIAGWPQLLEVVADYHSHQETCADGMDMPEAADVHKARYLALRAEARRIARGTE